MFRRGSRSGVVLFFSLALPSALLATEGGFSLEQILSAPFPTQLRAAPHGGKLAWVLNDRGVRNVWVAEAPAYAPRRLTPYRDDDGQAIGGLDWTPDGEALVYVRGGPANREGDFPNPRSHPQGAEQALWLVRASDPPSEPRRLDEGHSPAVSPRGDGVAYRKQDEIWFVPLAENAKPTLLVRPRGRPGSLRWSPDGARLAFVSDRGDHSFIGVFDTDAGTLRYLDPSVDRDTNPVFSPDGREIAFLRIPPRGEPFTFGPRRTGEPWSIRVADVASGKGREVWRAADGPGSVFRGVVADSQLLWGSGDRLIFPWEVTGWTHLYSLAAHGGDAVSLTSGPFEVEHVALSPSRDEVLFSSNQDDPHRRHLWKVAVQGGTPQAVTTGRGIEWSPVATADGEALAFLRAGPRRPPRVAVQVGSRPARDLDAETLPADFPQPLLVEPEPVVFPAADGMEIPAQLFLPAAVRRDHSHPAVIFFHGGSRRQMLLGWHYSQYYTFCYALNQYLASRGYLVLSVNYRSGIGYGMEFREAIDYGAHGASEFNDVRGAGLYLRARPEVDGKRIGLWGGSYGGYLTALGLARASDLFAAGVDLHGVHDWNPVIRNFAPQYDPLERPEFARRAFESSPLHWVQTWRSPVLLIHGDDDRNVPFSQTVELVRALREQGVAFEELVFPDEVHGFLTHSRWLEAYTAAVDFFERHLGQLEQDG